MYIDNDMLGVIFKKLNLILQKLDQLQADIEKIKQDNETKR